MVVNKTDQVLALRAIPRGTMNTDTGAGGWGAVREAVLGRVVREVFPGKVTLELRPKSRGGVGSVGALPAGAVGSVEAQKLA